MVLFSDVPRSEAPAAGGSPRPRPARASRPGAAADQPVAAGAGGHPQYLRSVIEEQETTNEELKAANEEILSSNEELQSTNEELQSAKEELQATNEELTTVNDELRHRNEEATRSTTTW